MSSITPLLLIIGSVLRERYAGQHDVEKTTLALDALREKFGTEYVDAIIPFLCNDTGCHNLQYPGWLKCYKHMGDTLDKTAPDFTVKALPETSLLR